MDPGTVRAKNSSLYEQNNFISQLGEPEGIQGEILEGYPPSTF
jgi:hypothetical protein